LAAEQGHVPSQSKLGRCYYFGEGVDKDPKEASKWWTYGAEASDAYSQYNLGVCYSKGFGVEQVSLVFCYYFFSSGFRSSFHNTPHTLEPRNRSDVVRQGGGAGLRGFPS